ncbi:MAG: ROK family transcriptional regulator [Bacteroidales bacterium]
MPNNETTITSCIQEDPTKQRLTTLFIDKGAMSIAEIAKEISLSVPTVTKILRELKKDNLVIPIEKSQETGTWNATLYNLNPETGYFMGVDIKHNRIIITLTDFLAKVIKTETYLEFKLWENPDALEHVYNHLDDFLSNLPIPRNKILSIGMSIPGRINSLKGISYSFFYNEELPLAQEIEQKYKIPVMIDNDTRCMGYGEYMLGTGKGRKNVVYANISWGIGVAIIINKQIYYGKSGFSGEYGHISVFDNEILCFCGKKGCLETEASGSAIHRKFLEEYKNGRGSILRKQFPDPDKIALNDILEAAKKEDILAIDLIQNTGRTLGKYLAGLLNLFNPDVLVLGGTVGRMGDYITYAIKSSLMKYSLNYVNNDTEILCAQLDDMSTSLGACLLSRSKLLGLIEFSEN